MSLVCPACGTAHHDSERFCRRCGLPLVRAEAPIAVHEPPDPRREQARKVKPQLADGSLVRVAGAHNQAEAEFIQGLLLEEGVPSMVRRSRGFDVPDFLAAGPREILVPQSGVVVAREVLLEADLIGAEVPNRPADPVRLLAALIGALAIGALVVLLLSRIA